MKQEAAKRGKVVIERSYRANIQDVWDLWTTKAGLKAVQRLRCTTVST